MNYSLLPKFCLSGNAHPTVHKSHRARKASSSHSINVEESQAVGQGPSVGPVWRALILGKADKCPNTLEMERGLQPALSVDLKTQ